jgi:hypothetical protein
LLVQDLEGLTPILEELVVVIGGGISRLLVVFLRSLEFTPLLQLSLGEIHGSSVPPTILAAQDGIGA